MKKKAKKKPVPTNPQLYARVSGYIVKTYKARGGGYRMA
jgi:hypothetical protein